MSFGVDWPGNVFRLDHVRPDEYLTGERMRRLNEEARKVGSSAGDGRAVMPEGESGRSASTLAGAAPGDTPHPGRYRPVELETHEDFAVKLAERPKGT